MARRGCGPPASLRFQRRGEPGLHLEKKGSETASSAAEEEERGRSLLCSSPSQRRQPRPTFSDSCTVPPTFRLGSGVRHTSTPPHTTHQPAHPHITFTAERRLTFHMLLGKTQLAVQTRAPQTRGGDRGRQACVKSQVCRVLPAPRHCGRGRTRAPVPRSPRFCLDTQRRGAQTTRRRG